MNAHQARELATGINNQAALKDYNKIQSAIDAAANQGKNEIFWYENIHPGAESKLKEEGFIIKSESHRNELLITIKW